MGGRLVRSANAGIWGVNKVPSVSPAFELCVICNASFVNLTRVMRKTCSSECSRKNKNRRKEARRKQKRARLREMFERFCQTCNVDISYRRENARYCSRKCSESGLSRIKRDRSCRKCGQPVSLRRFVCDGCLIPKKYVYKKGYSYINRAKTSEERLNRITRTRQNTKRANLKAKIRIAAANEIYSELFGKPAPANPPSQPLPPPTCVVCGILITGWRQRILCGSRSCAAARIKETSRSHYYGKPLSASPRMIATAELKGTSKYRNRNWRNKKRNRNNDGERRNARHQRRYAVYVAMREMKLLPKENNP
jgi:hypothetical protein